MSDETLRDCDVLIVGGGPAGSACATRLRKSGFDVLILDKAEFPRDKICAGWITPPIVRALELSTDDYRRDNVMQPITGFRTGVIGRAAAVHTDYDHTVSYGIRRCEFDNYLLRHSGAELQLGTPLKSLETADGRWIVNGQFDARIVIGAGGHFCPVARRLNSENEHRHDVVQAQEIEFLMTDEQQRRCAVAPEIPELYFCADMQGYGWCFRKGKYLNIGLGREGERRLGDHVADFLQYLRATQRIDFDPPGPFKGHAYRLYGKSPRKLVDNGLMVIGDALGLAYPQSGEGIRPAIESGLIAADVIAAANGDFCRASLEDYAARIRRRFGEPGGRSVVDWLPASMRAALARGLLGTKSFTRRVLLDRWFLHAAEPDLELCRT